MKYSYLNSTYPDICSSYLLETPADAQSYYFESSHEFLGDKSAKTFGEKTQNITGFYSGSWIGLAIT